MDKQNQAAFDLSSALANLNKIMEQFEVPGIDTKEILQARRKDVEALIQANQAIYSGMQTMANKQGELLKKSMEDIQAAMKSAGVGVGDPSKQSEIVRKAYDTVLAHMRDLAEIARQSQAEAMAKITARANESAEEIKKALQIK